MLGAVAMIALIVGTALLITSSRRPLQHRRLRARFRLGPTTAEFRALADAIPTLCWMADADGWIYWYNRRWYEFTGTSPAEMQGWGWQSVHDPECLPGVMQRWKAAIASGQPFEMVFPLRRADGRYCPVLTRIAPLRDDRGLITHWFGVNTDVSEQMQAEEALTAERDRSQGILENMREGFLLLDREFRILQINAEGLRMEQRPASELIGRTHWEAYPGTAEAEIGRLYKHALESGEPVSLDHCYAWPAGHEVWLEMRAYPSPDRSMLSIFYRDVSDRKRAEIALQQATDRLDAILNNTTMAVFMMDDRQHCAYMNPAAEQLTGYTFAETQGRPLHDVVHHTRPDGSAYPLCECPIDQAFPENDQERGEEIFVHKDGSFYPVAFTASPIRNERGEPVGTVIEARNIEAELRTKASMEAFNANLERRVAEEVERREQAEAQLRQAQKMEAVGRLTGGVAHDFNNLLTVVGGNLEMLQKRLGPGADARALRLVANAMEGAGRAATLTHRLLAFSRQSPLQPEVVDVNKLLAGMSDLLQRTLGEHIAVETVLAGGLWRTEADPNQMENAVLNLAVNARDAMPEGGRLTIETANSHLDELYAAHSREPVTPGQYVLVSVSDTGIGMARDVLERVFEPFFTTKPVGKGTGLGLAQVYGFMRQTGGHAAVYSEVSEGTTIKLYFPRLKRTQDRVQEDETALVAPLLTPDAQPGAGITILVVEDDAMVRDFAVSALEEAGFVVLAAEDGASGLALLDAHPDIQVLFTDVVLTGGLNGRRVSEEALRRRPDLKVLFTTGYTRNAIIHQGRLDEGVNLLGKPFTAATLVHRLCQIVDRPVQDHTKR
ncbi:PAS domain-containing protein [Methylobacterium brachiatum]|jgi:PAS domain S-box-containing protein|uniref:PAS domain-containing protein n=1 Tax=Methylobacterium brachiatum TaxID=269660 RepID=UPI0024486F45|nr:PAS domain-containing protein [Methylobacterium brachiatum]MDH2313268.1 PAS domain-containing protein [Methylobacterium brachiatum]